MLGLFLSLPGMSLLYERLLRLCGKGLEVWIGSRLKVSAVRRAVHACRSCFGKGKQLLRMLVVGSFYMGRSVACMYCVLTCCHVETAK